MTSHAQLACYAALAAAFGGALAGVAGATPTPPAFPAGIESKTAGVESGLHAADAPALLYNPANLRSREAAAAPFLEVGLVNAVASYEEPQFDPVVVKVTSPLATVGLTYPVAATNGRLTLGGIVFPSANGRQHIPGLPRKIGGTLQALVVDTSDQVIDVGFGASYRLADGWSLGSSLVHTSEFHTLKAAAPGNPRDLADMSYHNQFDRPVVGARFDQGSLLAAVLAARPPQARPYHGTQTLSASAAGTTSPAVQSFVPTTLDFGVQGHLGHAALGVETVRQEWAQGRGVVKDGISVDRPVAALSDVTQTSVTGGYTLPRGWALTVGYADLPSPWGDGRDDGVLSDHVHGADFGAMDAVHRRSLGIGAQGQLYGASVGASLARTAGTRVVGPGGENVGYYTLTVTTASVELVRAF